MIVKHVFEVEIVIVLESHSAEDDHVDFRLHRDPGKELVVRLAGDREDRQFLGFNKRVEQVDHRNTGTDHILWKNTLRRVK